MFHVKIMLRREMLSYDGEDVEGKGASSWQEKKINEQNEEGKNMKRMVDRKCLQR